MDRLGPEIHRISADDVKRRFAVRQAHYSPSNVAEALEYGRHQPDDDGMSDMSREEIKARLDASEAKMATAVESLRADGATLRADVTSGLAEIRAQGDRAQVSADKFYAEAGRLLAEIRLAGEQNKTTVMGLGYKVAAWLFGAIVAVGSLSVAVYKAVTAALS